MSESCWWRKAQRLNVSEPVDVVGRVGEEQQELLEQAFQVLE